MFDAVMSDEFASINKALVEDKIDVNIRGAEWLHAALQRRLRQAQRGPHAIGGWRRAAAA